MKMPRLPKHPAKLLFPAGVIVLAGCFPNADERYDSGYSDGYAVGFNTTCEIRATLIEGDWDNADYSRGYADGTADGSTECLRQKKAGLL
jgi:hypothetical protein